MSDERDERRVPLTRRRFLEGAAGAAASFGVLGLAACGGEDADTA